MTVLLNKTLRRKIVAGGSEHFVSEGRYLYLESATPPVASTDLLLTVDDVVQGFIAPGVGYETEPDQQFSTFRVENTTGADVTVLIIVGFGRIIDNRFVASGTVAVQGVAGGVSVPVDVSPVEVGTSRVFFSHAVTEIYGQYWTPATNVNGIILTNLHMTPIGAGDASIQVSTVQPIGRGTRRTVLASTGATESLKYPLLVPAGLGMWGTRHSGAGAFHTNAAWRVL